MITKVFPTSDTIRNFAKWWFLNLDLLLAYGHKVKTDPFRMYGQRFMLTGHWGLDKPRI